MLGKNTLIITGTCMHAFVSALAAKAVAASQLQEKAMAAEKERKVKGEEHRGAAAAAETKSERRPDPKPAALAVGNADTHTHPAKQHASDPTAGAPIHDRIPTTTTTTTTTTTDAPPAKAKEEEPVFDLRSNAGVTAGLVHGEFRLRPTESISDGNGGSTTLASLDPNSQQSDAHSQSDAHDDGHAKAKRKKHKRARIVRTGVYSADYVRACGKRSGCGPNPVGFLFCGVVCVG